VIDLAEASNLEEVIVLLVEAAPIALAQLAMCLKGVPSVIHVGFVQPQWSEINLEFVLESSNQIFRKKLRAKSSKKACAQSY
jgi:hypothetical protein